MEKFDVETGDRIPPRRDQNPAGIAAQLLHPLASAEERAPFGQGFVSTMQNDSGPLRKASAPLGHGETGASFWQAQRAGPRLLEAV